MRILFVVIYLSYLKSPPQERNKEENFAGVGIISCSQEPSQNVNSFQDLWWKNCQTSGLVFAPQQDPEFGNAITIIIIINTRSRSIVIIKTSSSPLSSLLLLSFPDEVHLIPINNLILPLKNTQIRQVHSIFLSQFIRDMTDQPSGNYEVLMVSPGKSSLISNHVPRCQMGCSMFQNLSPFVDFLLCIGHIFCFILKLKWNAQDCPESIQ